MEDEPYDYRQQMDDDRRREEEEREWFKQYRAAWQAWANQETEKEKEHG